MLQDVGRVVIILGIVLTVIANLKKTEIPTPQPKQNEPSVSTGFNPVTATPAVQRVQDSTRMNLVLVTRVIDGDTIQVETSETVRYIGIDTPEIVHPDKPVECSGQQAANKNKELVLGKSVTLEKDVSETDRYGRLLRYVWVGDTFVNDYLIQNGFAKSSSYPPDIKYQQQFLESQKYAQQNSLGLWSSSLCNSNHSNNPNLPN